MVASSDQRSAASCTSSASSRWRCLHRRLAVGVAQPGRQLPQVRADGVPVLAEQDHAVLVVERDDSDRARGGSTTSRIAVPPPGMATVSLRSEMTRPS